MAKTGLSHKKLSDFNVTIKPSKSSLKLGLSYKKQEQDCNTLES